VQLLATASRDRLLHIFDMNHNYGLVQTLDDHSSAITAIRFTELDGQLMMLSCGVDKSLLFRNVQMDPDFHFVLNRHMVSRTTLYDMEVDLSGKFVATACQDRNIRIYNTRNGKQKKCYSGSASNDGTLLRLELDPSNNYAATSSSDKSLSVYDFFSGECIATMFGHSEISTGIKFLDDLKHFVSVSVDGCIFVWRLPSELTEHIRDRLTSIQTSVVTSLPSSSTSLLSDCSARRETFVVPDKKRVADSNDNFHSPGLPFSNDGTPDMVSSRPDYRFSVGQLPSWAKRQVLQESYVKTPAGSAMTNVNALPKGRWASRIDDPSLVVKSLLDTSSVQDPKLFNEDASSTVSSSSDPKSKVSFITDDDENNRDDELDDEFKAGEKIHSQQAVDGAAHTLEIETSNRPAGNEKFVPSRQSSVSADDDEDDGSENKETVYYLPSKDSDIDPNFDSTFKVYEGAVGKLSGPDCTEEDDEETVKSPVPSDSNKDILSDVSSIDEEKRDQFGEHVMSHEKFDSALTRLEEEAIGLNSDSPGHCLGSRQSISALFLSRSLMPSQSRTLFKGPSQLIERNRDLLSRIGERKSTVEMRDANVHPREINSALSGSSTAVGRKARLGSTEGKPSIMANADLKLEPFPASSSTLPRTARNHKSSRQSMSAAVESTITVDRMSGNCAADNSEPMSYKRRSAAHSYRMQTESSMAKLASNKDLVSDVKKKELLAAMRFPSTPNLPAEVKTDDEGPLDAESADRNLTAADDDIFIKPAWPGRHFEAAITRKDSNRLKTTSDVGNPIIRTGPTVNNQEVTSRAAQVAGPAKATDGVDRSLMPPPLSSSVPSSIQASFIAKAAKHRRTTMPESVSQSKDILGCAVAGAKSNRTSESAVGFGIAEGSSDVTGTGKQNLAASPLEPPERDVSILHSQSNVLQTGLTGQVRNVMDHETSKFGQSSPPAFSDSQLPGPKVVKIGRCTSPLRPSVMKTVMHADIDTTVTHHGAQDPGSSLVSRRQLPVSPRLSETSQSAEAAVSWRCSPGVSISSSHLQMTTSGSASSLQSTSSSGSFSPTASFTTENRENLSNNLQLHLTSTMCGSRPSSGISPRFSSAETTNQNNLLPVYSMSPDSADATQTWMKRAQQMQHQWEQRQQQQHQLTSVTATKTDTSFSPQLLANSERSKTETLLSQHAIIHEIERYCEERRWSKDCTIERPDRLDIGQGAEQVAADDVNTNSSRRRSDDLPLDRRTVVGVVDPRQQWEKAKQVKPFTVSSSSTSTFSRSHSSVLSPDEGTSTSVPSLLQQNMANSASSVYSADDVATVSHHPDSIPMYATNPRRSTVRATTAPPDNVGSAHTRRSRPLSRSAVPNDSEQPSEGEPDGTDVVLPREQETAILPALTRASNDMLTASSSQSGASLDERSSALTNDMMSPSDEHCSKLASDLTQAATRVADMYTELNSGNDSSKDPATCSTRERALRILRESLTDASSILSKSLVVGNDKLHYTAADSDATTHMMEAMLERYSQQLSSQVYQLFKQKLDELQTATKL
jgi:WD40 repeat protein